MRRLIFLSVMLWFTTLPGFAQKHDNTWVFGYYYGILSPVAGLDFYWGAPDTVGFYPPLQFLSGSVVNMSNAAGDLQFITNGEQISNMNNQVMQGSANFNQIGTYHSLFQGVLGLPTPGFPNKYHVLTLPAIPTGTMYVFPIGLYDNLIDMNMNGGSGMATSINSNVFMDTLMQCVMQATKHGNGRDWWVINHKALSNTFYVSLLTPQGFTQHTPISTGPTLEYFLNGASQSVFSPDGSLFAIAYNKNSSLYLFDFDRCSGTISYRDSVHIAPNDSSEWFVYGCSFSPNSRYLYATTNNDLYQFDTQDTSLTASQKYIAAYDGFTDPFTSYFFRHAPGPDGKIYITNWNGSWHLGVINDPDAADTLCNFGQHQLLLVSPHASNLPEISNYRLGPLTGSACDSLTDVNDYKGSINSFTAYPNPSHGKFTISYSLDAGTEGSLEIFNETGQLLHNEKLPQWSITRHLDISTYPRGIYFLHFQNAGKTFNEKIALF